MTDHIGDTNKMIGNTPRTDAISLITEYLEIGGFFNPEIVNVQQHEAVRDTLMQARKELNAANDLTKQLETTIKDLEEIIEYQRKKIHSLEYRVPIK